MIVPSGGAYAGTSDAWETQIPKHAQVRARGGSVLGCGVATITVLLL